MKTILRRIEHGTGEYYCIIEHDLEKYTLCVKNPWELSDEELCTSYLINKGLHLANYVSTMQVTEEEASGILNAHYAIEDKNNIFALLSRAFKTLTPTKLLSEYSGYKWVFNKDSLWLESKEDKKSILEPFEYFCEAQNERYSYNSPDTEILSILLKDLADFTKPNWLVGVNCYDYSYPIFRTVWYDVIVFLEYSIMNLELLNTMAKLASDWEGIALDNTKLLSTPVRRNNKDIAVELTLTKLNTILSRCVSVPDVYKKISEFNNNAMSSMYRHIVKQLTFNTETTLDWEKFYKVYDKHLYNYVIGILTYMRWSFIVRCVNIPDVFQIPLEIKTPLGRLIMRGGEPVWES